VKYYENVPLVSKSNTDYTSVLILRHTGRSYQAEQILNDHKRNTRSFYRNLRKQMPREQYYAYLREKKLCYGRVGLCLQPVEEGTTRCRDCKDILAYYQARVRLLETIRKEVVACE
jgi:hypothetical protein